MFLKVLTVIGTIAAMSVLSLAGRSDVDITDAISRLMMVYFLYEFLNKMISTMFPP